MKKKILFLFFMVMLSIFTFGAFDASAATYGDLTYTISNGKATITDCKTSASGELVIPSTLDGYPVTSIGNVAFEGCSSLASVTIPDGVTSIGRSAFAGCSSLTSVEIPDSVTSIGETAFYYCSRLTSVVIPDGVTSIGRSAFAECSSLTSVYITDISTWCKIDFYNYSSNPLYCARNLYLNEELVTNLMIPDGVTSIGSYAFARCSNLTNIEIPDSVTSIGDSAFYYCSSLISVEIPDSVTSIGDSAFYYCSSLISVEIPDGVTSISDKVFYYCGSLTSVEIPDSVTSVGENAFYGCGRLTSVYITDISTWCKIDFYNYSSNPLYYARNLYLNEELVTNLIIPDSVTWIGSYAFYYCSSLTSVKIPDSVKIIESYAFYYCSSLTSVKIPESVKIIESYAFGGCNSLVNVYYEGAKAKWTSISFGYSTNITNANMYYEFEELYTENGLEYVICKNNAVLKSAKSTVSGEVEIPKVVKNVPVTSIEDKVFHNCSSLTSVKIPESVTSIGDSAFYNCSSLTSVEIPESMTSVGEYAFYGCSSLTNVYYGGTEAQWDSISIGKNNTNFTSANRYYEFVGFYTENGLEYVIYKNNAVLKSAKSTVSGEVEIPKVVKNVPVTSIGDKVFYYCSSLTSVEIPNSVTSIGSYAFYGCSRLTSVVIPDGVTNIGSYAFDECSSLTSVYITDISTWCKIDFYNYSSNPLYCARNLYLNEELVTNLMIPDGVTSIGSYAFAGCSNLTNIEIPDSVTSIGDSAFFYCSSLISVEIPDGVTSIEDYAFYGCSRLTSVYYVGTKDEWSNINIGSSNSNLANNVKFCTYVTLVSEDGEKTVVSEVDKPFDMTLIPQKDGYGMKIYCDAEYKNLYDSSSNVTENMTLYVKYVEMKNELGITGAESVMVGDGNVTQTVLLTTVNDADYLLCTVKFPEYLVLEDVIDKDFKYVSEDSRKTEGGFTYVTFICQYADDGGIPTRTEVSPFELIFSVSKEAPVKTIEIEMTENSILIGEQDYTFDVITNSSLKILPKLAERIVVSCSNTISAKTQYKATVYPEYVTNKEVSWSVDDETIATVDDEGYLTPLKNGTIVLTATAKDGSGVFGTKTINVIVYAKINSLTVSDGVWDKAFDKDIFEYTVYVKDDTASVNVTPSFSGGGTLKYNNSTTMINNRASTVTLTDEKTVITLNRSGVADCTNSEYKITFIKDSIKYGKTIKTQTSSETTAGTTSFTVSSLALKNGDTVCLAIYEGNRLKAVMYETYASSNLTFSTDEVYDSAKVFVLDGLSTLKPLAMIEEVE